MKKSTRRSFSFLVCLVLLLTVLSPAALAAESSPHTNPDVKWEERAFGQSTDLNFTSTVDTENYPEKVGVNEARVSPEEADGTIGTHPGDATVTMESRGGKITGGHDGLVFYYTTLNPHTQNFTLSADVKVLNYGKLGTNDSPQQCGFGIMARDTVGPARQDPFDPTFQEIPSASNMFYVGVNAGSRDANKPAITYRRGVVDASNLVGVSTSKASIDEAAELKTNDNTLRMELGRDEKGFFARVQTADGDMSEKTYVDNAPVNLLQQQDDEHMYVGFFASRNAEVEFTNIELTITEYTEPGDLPPLWVPVNNAVKPTLYLRSGTTSSTASYNLTLYGNEEGTVSVTRDGESVGTVDLVAEKPAALPVTLKAGENTFECVYTYEGGSLTETYTIVYTETKLPVDEIYASPDGTAEAAGTKDDPTDVTTAMSRVAQGGTVYLLEGEYSTNIEINPNNSGSLDGIKTIRPADGAKVHIKNANLSVTGFFWHVYGLEFSGISSSLRGAASFNTVELCVFHDCNETGLSLGNGTGNGFQFAWPSYNTIKNCTSYNNLDSQHMNADGFAPKLGVGPGNVFDGCIAYGNVDDGFDLYNKVEKGPNAPITIRNCIAYDNGTWVNPEDPSDIITGGGGGNGFKVGGEGMAVAHVIENCIAFGNRMAGFSDNFNPGSLTLTNNTSFNNGQQNYIIRDNPLTAPSGTYRNNLSIRTVANPDWIDSIKGDVDSTNFLYNGTDCTNGTFTVKASDFVSVERPTAFERNADGSINYGDFLRLNAGSALVTAGMNGGYVGALTPSAPVAPPAPPVPVVPAVTAKVEEAEGGSVELDSTTAKAGETVTATLTPDEGMKAEGLIVTDAEGNPVEVAANGDGTYSFVMSGAAPVTVKGIFVEDCPSEAFPDLDVDGWYIEYTDYVIGKAIMNGDNGLFRPHDSITRAELATVLWNLGGNKAAGDTVSFTDVADGVWYAQAVRWAAGEGIVNGYEDGSFRPDQAVTREELATMLYRYAQKADGAAADPEYVIAYDDAGEIGAWAREAMSWCVKNGIVQGSTATAIEPAEDAERCQVAAMLTRYLKPEK